MGVIEGKTYAEQTRRKAAIDLAQDLSKHFGVEIDPDRLTTYLNSRWWLASPLAHAIHRETEPDYFNEVELETT